mmetsp:Transcript_13288/g.15543  ORF Transcript_13288/g.15543 Transcript_13288/m.15543 type:complete len:441 (+) Transcript_13288:127-1449(+)
MELIKLESMKLTAAEEELGEALLKSYMRHCEHAELADPSVLTSLRTQWSHISASSRYSLLPLYLALKETGSLSRGRRYILNSLRVCAVEDLDARFSNPLSDSNARAIRGIIECSDALLELDVSGIGLGSKGVLEIMYGVSQSRSLSVVRLSKNPRGFAGFADPRFAKAISVSHLQVLDVSENHLDWHSLKLLRKVKPPQLILVDNGNHIWEESLNTLTHGLGAAFALMGSWVMLWNAYGKSRRTFYAAMIYCFTSVFLFSSSAIYHSAYANKRMSWILHILDHCAIYLLIAGSYTPFCLIALKDVPLGSFIAGAEWALAFVGIILTFTAKRIKIPFLKTIELVLYLGMGHLIYLVYDEAVRLISSEALDMLKYGGYCYTFGVIFFLLDKYHPIGHTIWHVFVMAGAAFHYFAVMFYVVGFHDEHTLNTCMNEEIRTLPQT